MDRREASEGSLSLMVDRKLNADRRQRGGHRRRIDCMCGQGRGGEGGGLLEVGGRGDEAIYSCGGN